MVSTLLTDINAYYKLDTSGSCPDSVNSYDLTIDWATFANGWGKINSAYTFDWTNDMIEANTNCWISSLPFSVSMWVYRDWNTWFRVPFQFCDKDAAEPYCRIIFDDNQPQINMRTAGGAMASVKSTAISDQTWYHFVWVWTDSSTMNIYQDWVDVTWAYSWTQDPTASFDRFSIGRAWDSSPWAYWQGKLDECWVWNKALTTDEIAELYNSWAWLQYPFTSTVNTTNFFQFI